MPKLCSLWHRDLASKIYSDELQQIMEMVPLSVVFNFSQFPLPRFSPNYCVLLWNQFQEKKKTKEVVFSTTKPNIVESVGKVIH